MYCERIFTVVRDRHVTPLAASAGVARQQITSDPLAAGLLALYVVWLLTCFLPVSCPAVMGWVKALRT